MRRPLALLALLAIVAGCSTGPSGPAKTASPAGTPGTDGITLAAAKDVVPLAATAGDAAKAGDAVNAFGMDAYRRLVAADPTGNLVISPASIQLALAMARAGAKGVTATEMDAVMRDLGTDADAASVAALQQALNARTATFKDAEGKDQDVILRVVNAPFAQRDYALQQAYLDALAARFGAGLRLVDYKGNPEGSRGAINGWVADQTEDRIPELLGQGTIDESTRIVLVNAIYLKAAWQFPFYPDATDAAPFTGLDGTTTDVQMMHSAFSMGYAQGADWQAVELPYVGGKLSMLLVLPKDLAAFEKGLDGTTFAAIPKALGQQEVMLSLPKWSTETQAKLKDLLAAMGMPTAFTDKADFSGITTEEPLRVSDVIHQANIDVDESGTEAAAATAVIAVAGAAPGTPPPSVVFDRPFLFALRDTETGAVLFLGRVTQPLAATKPTE
jgi:serpin B